MAVRFDAAADFLTRTTTLPTITSFTLLGWAYAVSAFTTFGSVLEFGGASGGLYYALALTSTSGGRVTLWNGSAQTTGTTAVAINTWVHLGITVAGTGAGQVLVYLNGVQEFSASGNATNTATSLFVGNSAESDAFGGRVAAVKIYSAVLTADEIKTEMRVMMPLRTANVNTWSPLLTHTDVGNYAGTGAWTVGGTLTTEQGPPVAWSVGPVRQQGRAAPAPAVGKAPPPRRAPWRFARSAA